MIIVSKKIDRTGGVAYNTNGEKMVIVRYGNRNDIDIQLLMKSCRILENIDIIDYTEAKR